MLAQTLRENGASVLIDGEDLAGAEQRGGELIALIGIRREVFDQIIDLVDQTLAAGVERGRIKRRIAVDAVEPVFGQDCAERSGDRDAAFGVDLVGECRHKLVHLPLMRIEADWSDWTNKQRFGAGARLGKMGGGGGADPPVASKERGLSSPTLLTERAIMG